MKKLILIVLWFAALGAFAQTQPTLPAGSTVYGNTYYLDPDGNVWAGSAAKQYRNIGLKAYVDSLDNLGWSNSQIDSAITSKIALAPVPTLQQVTTAGNTTSVQNVRFTGGIHLTGLGTAPASGLSLGGNSGGSQIIAYSSSNPLGRLDFSPSRSALSYGSTSSTVNVREQTPENAGVVFGVSSGAPSPVIRASGADAVNANDFTTLGQVTALIPDTPTLQEVTSAGNTTTDVVKASSPPVDAEDLTNKEYVDSLGTGFGLSYNSGTGKFDWGTYTDLGGGFSQYSVAIPANSILGVGDINSSDPLIMIDNTTVGKQAAMRVGSTSDYVVFNVSGTDHSGKIHIVSSIEGSRKGLEFNGTDGVISYTDDYSANFTDRSLVDKGFVDNTFLPLTGGTLSGLATIEASGIGKLDLKSTVATGSTAIRFLDNADAQKGYIGFASSNNDVFTVSNVLAQPMSFRTNNLERLSIADDGLTTFSYATVFSPLTITANGVISEPATIFVRRGSTPSTNAGVLLEGNDYQGNNAFYFRTYATSGVQLELALGGINANGAYTNTSDIRLKDTVSYDYGAVDSLNTISFKWKDNRDNGRIHVGYSAQEVKEVLPDAVYTQSDEDGNEIEGGILSVDHVQVLIAKMALLEKKVKELEQKIEELEDK